VQDSDLRFQEGRDLVFRVPGIPLRNHQVRADKLWLLPVHFGERFLKKKSLKNGKLWPDLFDFHEPFSFRCLDGVDFAQWVHEIIQSFIIRFQLLVLLFSFAFEFQVTKISWNRCIAPPIPAFYSVRLFEPQQSIFPFYAATYPAEFTLLASFDSATWLI
jgi:hypothetical protein